MLQPSTGAKVMLPPELATAGVTNSMVIDTTGADFLQFDLILGTHSPTTGNWFQTIKWSESDSSTDYTSMTDIVALTGGTATSSTVGFVIPYYGSASKGTVLEFNIDLRKRQKYMALVINGPAMTGGGVRAGGWVAGSGDLYGAEQSADSPEKKSASTRYDNTNASACVTVVTV